MAPNDEEVQTLDDDTLEHLEQVRKGKPRKFVMLCKGAKILGLVVFKKGNYEKHIKAAKKSAGTGVPVFGVVDGRGPNINFRISRADGFDKEPVKTTVLRSFLADEAEYKAMPVFEIVSELGPVLDGDDPLVQRFTSLQELALAMCDKHPGRADEINALCLKIGKTLDGEDSQQAEPMIAELELMLGALSAPPPPPQPGTTPQKPDVDPKLLSQLTDELKRLHPEVELLTKAGAGDVGKLKALLADIAKDREQGAIQAALGRCREIADYLAEEWNRQSRTAEERVDALLTGLFAERGGDVEKIKSVFGFAQERAGDARYGSALVALLNLGKLLDAAEGPDAKKEADVIEKGTVAARKKLVESRWQQTIRDVRMEIGTLRTAIRDQNPDEDADELVGAIDEAINDFCDDFNQAIFNFGKAKDGDQKPIDRILDTIEDYRKQIDASPLINHLDEAKEGLGVSLGIAGRLHKALDEISENLKS